MKIKPLHPDWKAGDKVIANGYQGTIYRVYVAPTMQDPVGLYEVRLPGGLCCIGGNSLQPVIKED